MDAGAVAGRAVRGGGGGGDPQPGGAGRADLQRPKNLGFKPNKLNPANGLKRIFGVNGWIELVKSLLKVLLLERVDRRLDAVAHRAQIDGAGVDRPQPRAIATLGDGFLLLLFAMAGGLVVIAAIDVPVQGALRRLKNLKVEQAGDQGRAQGERGLARDQVGDPRPPARILKRNFRKAVAGARRADQAPTHFAVALRYDRPW